MANLHCASCGRIDSESESENGVSTFTYLGATWCTSCAAIEQTADGEKYVSTPSPGQMYEGPESDPLDTWIDCYEYKPKKRILVKKAKSEIQRAWSRWEGDKSNDLSMFTFFAWLQKHRPYFLTFRGKGDLWQMVHSWLIQYEGRKKQKANSER